MNQLCNTINNSSLSEIIYDSWINNSWRKQKRNHRHKGVFICITDSCWFAVQFSCQISFIYLKFLKNTNVLIKTLNYKLSTTFIVVSDIQTLYTDVVNNTLPIFQSTDIIQQKTCIFLDEIVRSRQVRVVWHMQI